MVLKALWINFQVIASCMNLKTAVYQTSPMEDHRMYFTFIIQKVADVMLKTLMDSVRD